MLDVTACAVPQVMAKVSGNMVVRDRTRLPYRVQGRRRNQKTDKERMARARSENEKQYISKRLLWNA